MRCLHTRSQVSVSLNHQVLEILGVIFRILPFGGQEAMQSFLLYISFISLSLFFFWSSLKYFYIFKININFYIFKIKFILFKYKHSIQKSSYIKLKKKSKVSLLEAPLMPILWK